MKSSNLALGLLLAAVSGLPALGQNYTVTNLSLGGSWSSATGMNASGQVAGVAGLPNGHMHAFFWTPAGGMIDLGTLGGPDSMANGISNSGQVVGWSHISPNINNAPHAFSWTQAGGMVDLGVLGGGRYSQAFAVNDLGQVVGWTDSNFGSRAFLWTQSGGMIDLGTLGGFYSAAMVINASGQVAGYSDVPPGINGYDAFSWTQSGGMIDLGRLSGCCASPTAINGSGQVVGLGYLPNIPDRHAFSWTQAAGLVDLGTFGGTSSDALGLNDSGQVVGEAQTISGWRAFLWTQAGGMVNLGSLGGDFSWAHKINGSGQVVGGSRTGYYYEQHAFSWTPGGGMVDLQTRIPTAPPGIHLDDAYLINDKGLIVAESNVGAVVLGAISEAPVVGAISANDPVAKGSPVSVSAAFRDADTSATHTAVWSWGDGSSSSPGVVSETAGSGNASGSHAYSAAGVYTVSLKITDSAGLSAQISRDVVVYDASAGYVTGGGWFISPMGAFKQDVTLIGRATFGFVSKYQKGATVPTGNTEFQFQAANLNFHSDQYDWLVVAGARAQYKGTGTINGQGSYKFLLTAIDGDINGKPGQDRFRIKIWYYDSNFQQDVVVYDNQIDSNTEGGLTDGTLLGGGSIVIHQ